MNHLLSIRTVMATALVVCATVTAQAQIVGSSVNTAAVLNGHARCDHVLRLIHLHGVNNSVDRALGNSLLHHSPLGGLASPIPNWVIWRLCRSVRSSIRTNRVDRDSRWLFATTAVERYATFM